MPVPKKVNKKIKIANKNDNMKKKLLLFVAAFAVIGVIFLIRSFAATTVYGVNLVDIINANNPNWTVQGAKVVEIPDGKKTQKVVQLAPAAVLRYSFTMNPGYYKACYNLKPTTSDADADVALGIVGQNGLFSTQKLNVANGSVAVGKYNEHCVNLYEDGSGVSNKRFVAGVSINKGTWEVSTFAIRVDEDYASYASYGSYAGYPTPVPGTDQVAPIVTAQAPITITRTTAIINMQASIYSVTDQTASTNPLSRYGIRYGLDNGYVNGGGSVDITPTSPTAALGTQITLTNLKCNTTYHFAAYATNKYGSGFSPDSTFKTLQCATN